MKEETDYKKLYNILQMISLLQKPCGFKIKQLAQRFQVCDRTIQRYFTNLRSVGFEIDNDKANFYRIISHRKNESWFSDISFTLEEAELMKEAISALHPSHPLKDKVLEKLYVFSEMNDIAEIIADSHIGQHISLLSKAMKEEKQVLLLDYYSANSNQLSGRLVEPISFIRNMKYLLAYEVKAGKVKQYKPERIGKVLVTEQAFQYKEQHIKTLPDHFGMNSGKSDYINLSLSARACNLLKEEFPLTEEDIQKKYDGTYTYSSLVKGYEGVGRFVMGLPGEVTVLESEGLQQYIRDKLDNHYLKV